MEEGRPSTTAMGAAMVRAAHLRWDDNPKIFQDPLALGLSGVESQARYKRLSGDQAELARRFTLEFAQKFYNYGRAPR